MTNLPAVIVINDGEDVLINRASFRRQYFNLQELLILKKKVESSIAFALENDVWKLNDAAPELPDAPPGKAKEKMGYVYIMKDVHLGCLKIGFSVNPKFRESTLQAQKPTIILLHKEKAKKSVEKLVHKALSPFWMRGEWFRIDFEYALSVIKRLNK